MSELEKDIKEFRELNIRRTCPVCKLIYANEQVANDCKKSHASSKNKSQTN